MSEVTAGPQDGMMQCPHTESRWILKAWMDTLPVKMGSLDHVIRKRSSSAVLFLQRSHPPSSSASNNCPLCLSTRQNDAKRIKDGEKGHLGPFMWRETNAEIFPRDFPPAEDFRSQGLKSKTRPFLVFTHKKFMSHCNGLQITMISGRF